MPEAAPTSPEAPGFKDMRARRALGVVRLHATAAAASGALPVPILDYAAVAAITLRMVRALCEVYAVAFLEEAARADA